MHMEETPVEDPEYEARLYFWATVWATVVIMVWWLVWSTRPTGRLFESALCRSTLTQSKYVQPCMCDWVGPIIDPLII